jgi:hypothetical protein
MSVFDKIDQPYFFYKEPKSKEDDGMGEDVWFCEKVNEAGMEVWCDPTVEVSHVGEYIY